MVVWARTLIACAALVGTSAWAQDTIKKAKPDTVLVDCTERHPTACLAAMAARTWPVQFPAVLPGSILPAKRIVAFYGSPINRHMGILGALPPAQMLAKLDTEVANWNKADSTTPALPALHMIVVVAQNKPGRDGKYRLRADSSLIERVYGWAHEHHALLFLDLQVGHSTVQEELPRLVPFLRRRDVHLALDPEFSMKHGEVPGTVLGTLSAADVNYASYLLETLVSHDTLPPKVLVVHRFRRDMLTGYQNIQLDPRVQIVIDMDGYGPPWMKRDSYAHYIVPYPVEFTGFKVFYHNDTKDGDPLMAPADILKLFPRPVYIQYQ